MKLKALYMIGFISLLSACCMMCNKNSGTFTETDSGKTFATSPGSTISVDLKGNYTTGYSWNIAALDKNVLSLSPASNYVTNNPGLTGSGGVQHYIFNVTGKGKTQLKITYNRVWEKEVAPINTFILDIDSK